MHHEGMVREAIIHRVIEKIYEEFNGRCAPLMQIVEYVKKAVPDASYSLVRFALEVMARDGKVQKIKLYKVYVIYCFGKNPQFSNLLDYKKVEECVFKLVPSATLFQIAECALGTKPRGNPSSIYVSILYILARMVKDQKIHSFTVLLDAKDRLKVIVKKYDA